MAICRATANREINETILERLVALNAERTAEERNGHIRWPRPEYQAPEQVQATQTTLTGISGPAETAVTPVEQQKWRVVSYTRRKITQSTEVDFCS